MFHYSKKIDFMKFCIEQPQKNIELGSFSSNTKPYEATLVELSRELPHMRQIMTNAIEKLPCDKFSFSIVCTKENVNYIKEHIKDKISKYIIIHELPEYFKITNVNEYNNTLYTNIFWDFFKNKEKVLLMQEDTYIFKNNIQDFVNYDYIGAPWKYSIVKDYDIKFGNGGFSWRSVKLMKEAIEKESEITKEIKKIEKPQCYGRFEKYPEDVFFSFSAVYLKNYDLPTFEIAQKFSTENICCKESFGGHQFWMSDPNWKDRIKISK